VEIGGFRYADADIVVIDHQHVVVGHPGDVGTHAHTGRAIAPLTARGVPDGRLRHFAFDGDVDLRVGAREAFHQTTPDVSERTDRRYARGLRFRRYGGERAGRRELDRERLTERRRGESAGYDVGGRCVGGGRPGHAHLPVLQDTDVQARFLDHAGA